MNLDPIVFTHAVVVTSKSKEQLNKTNEIALIYLCAGPGDENAIAVLYGKLDPKGPAGALLPKQTVREGILNQPVGKEHGPTHELIFTGNILSRVIRFAEYAMECIKKSQGSVKINKKYRVSVSGGVEVVEEAKLEDYKAVK